MLCEGTEIFVIGPPSDLPTRLKILNNKQMLWGLSIALSKVKAANKFFPSRKGFQKVYQTVASTIYGTI